MFSPFIFFGDKIPARYGRAYNAIEGIRPLVVKPSVVILNAQMTGMAAPTPMPRIRQGISPRSFSRRYRVVSLPARMKNGRGIFTISYKMVTDVKASLGRLIVQLCSK